ncbi:hypothetical protein [Nocardiopsis sp. LOL_012]|uniref:hypothetical protein n=1 Tax=Nocardiopsis sp. LOL_012 TaxID=3345409 RepID=UPI003A84607D
MSSSEEMRAAVLALLKGDVTAEYDKARADVGSTLMEGDRRGIALPGPDGRPVRIGTAYKPNDTVTVLVDDDAALRWLKEYLPHEVTEAPRPGVMDRLKDEVRKFGGVLVRGEVVEVPWAEMDRRSAAPYVKRPAGEEQERAKAAVFAAFERGELSLEGLLARGIGAGEGPPD